MATAENGIEVPANINDNKTGTTNDVKWETLVELYNGLLTGIKSQRQVLLTIEETFSNVLQTSPELTKELMGAGQVTVELFTELTNLVKQHSTMDDVKANKIYPYSGVVNSENKKHMEVYINMIVAYEGLNTKLIDITEIVTTHILARMYEVASLNNITVTNKGIELLKTTGIEGAKDVTK